MRAGLRGLRLATPGFGSYVRSLPYRASVSTFETHERVDWPPGNRLRLPDISVTITSPDDDECVLLHRGDYQHHVRSSTTRDFRGVLLARENRAAAVTVHEVTHTLNQKAVRSLAQQSRRLTEWDARLVGMSSVAFELGSLSPRSTLRLAPALVFGAGATNASRLDAETRVADSALGVRSRQNESVCAARVRQRKSPIGRRT